MGTVVGAAVLGATGLSAAVASALIVAVVRRWAARHLVDEPNERSSHTVPTPRGGGIGIMAVVLAGGLVGLCCLPASTLLKALVPAAVIAGVSLWDDYRSLPARTRLAVHCLAAIAAIVCFGPLTSIGVTAERALALPSWLGYPLAFLWIVGLTNAYNFMDGIDGIAGLQGAIACAAWCTIGALSGMPALAWISVLCAGGCAGFLVFNWPPAKIFMGDVGSTFVGFLLALFPLWAQSIDQGAAWAPLVGFLVVWPFVLDAGLTFTGRLVRGENVLAAHRSHVYQRLVQGGRTHQRVAVWYGLAAALGGGGAVLWVMEIS